MRQLSGGHGATPRGLDNWIRAVGWSIVMRQSDRIAQRLFLRVAFIFCGILEV